ncbi:Holliday junction resolvase RuvX [Buchnera aphidicola]|uniref:Holliday junction resolvase RuvX n=1 Tax=Buchnera aphidicola TaxID=9 RepID=UPI00094C5E1A|nr:Holliday junction resolvase RuvX [Buchnera aphidicola]
MIILSIDYGTKTTGLAIAETQLNYSIPICSVTSQPQFQFWKQVDEVINCWSPEYIVVGYPYHIKKKINKKIKNFYIKIQQRFQKSVFLYNENYSTTEARIFLKKKKKPYCIHSISAKIILDSWLAENNDIIAPRTTRKK